MLTFKKPDLNAPRYKESSVNIISHKFLAKFKMKYPEYADLDYDTLKSIIHTDNTNIWKTIVNERDGVELRSSLGFIFVGSCTNKKKENVDFGKSIKTGIRTRHKNWGTDHLIGKIFYSNYATKYKVKHRYLWGFKGHRNFTRTVATEYPKDHQKYVVVEDKLRISLMFRDITVRRFMVMRANQQLVGYDEFSLD